MLGYLPERLLHQRGTPRLLFLPLVSALMASTCLALAFAHLPLLYPLCALAGFAFGGFWSLAPSLISELFGLARFAANYTMAQFAPMLGSFGLAAGLSGWVYEVRAAGHAWGRQGMQLPGGQPTRAPAPSASRPTAPPSCPSRACPPRSARCGGTVAPTARASAATASGLPLSPWLCWALGARRPPSRCTAAPTECMPQVGCLASWAQGWHCRAGCPAQHGLAPSRHPRLLPSRLAPPHHARVCRGAPVRSGGAAPPHQRRRALVPGVTRPHAAARQPQHAMMQCLCSTPRHALHTAHPCTPGSLAIRCQE